MNDPFADPHSQRESSSTTPTAGSINTQSIPPASAALNAHEIDTEGGLLVSPQHGFPEEADVLTVDRNATLTLATDALIVLDEGLRHQRRARTCCGLLPQLAKTTRAVPFTNILWAELDSYNTVTIQYAQTVGKKSCRVAQIAYPLSDKTQHPHAHRWVERVLARAYPPPVQRRPRVKVLVNPFGGQGYAARIWDREIAPIFAAARCVVDVERTARRGHAIDIAAALDIDAYDVVACASGDGLPHEVFNGLAKQPHPRRALRKIAVVQLPCGSGNAMCKNLTGTDSPSLTALAIIKGIRTPLDLVAITQGQERYFSFLSQSVGIIAEADLGTESLRWMGMMRFTWGVLVRIMGKTLYPAEVSVVIDSDDKRQIKQMHRTAAQQGMQSQRVLLDDMADGSDTSSTALPPLCYGTVEDALSSDFVTQDMPTLGNFYAGNMCWMASDAPFFSAAQPCDGLMDQIDISGTVSRLTSLRMLVAVGSGKLIDMPQVSYRKVRAYRVVPRVRDDSKDGRVAAIRARLLRWLGGHPAGAATTGHSLDFENGRSKQGLIAIDGERVPFEPFQAEIMPGLGMTLGRRPCLYEFDPPE